jgi:hypothetical protein
MENGFFTDLSFTIDIEMQVSFDGSLIASKNGNNEQQGW